MFSCEYCQISKNTFFYRTTLVAASKTWRAEEKGTLLQLLSREYLQIFLDSCSVELQQTGDAKMLSKEKNMKVFLNIFSLSFCNHQIFQFQNNNLHYKVLIYHHEYEIRFFVITSSYFQMPFKY